MYYYLLRQTPAQEVRDTQGARSQVFRIKTPGEPANQGREVRLAAEQQHWLSVAISSWALE
jgi:hypothetical protein